MFHNTILLSLALVGPINPTPTVKAAMPARPAVTAPIIQAQGHPMHIDFFHAGSKRADLRLRTASKGIDAAFTQWLQEEKPHIYRQAVDTAMVGVK
ncbi:MAG: hypothetical protein JWL77_3288 [Chthonomonadaceae bacterium]|nr:hypothetical protein [Chthonomonadaceae bacterium]